MRYKFATPRSLNFKKFLICIKKKGSVAIHAPLLPGTCSFAGWGWFSSRGTISHCWAPKSLSWQNAHRLPSLWCFSWLQAYPRHHLNVWVPNLWSCAMLYVIVKLCYVCSPSFMWVSWLYEVAQKKVVIDYLVSKWLLDHMWETWR